MGVSAAIALGAAIAGPKLLEATGLTKKPETPNLVVEQPPAAADANPNNADSMAAAAQQKKRAAAASGSGNTIKTGQTGLGELPGENKQQKTLLGY